LCEASELLGVDPLQHWAQNEADDQQNDQIGNARDAKKPVGDEGSPSSPLIRSEYLELAQAMLPPVGLPILAPAQAIALLLPRGAKAA
jgi:hypothetical protein